MSINFQLSPAEDRLPDPANLPAPQGRSLWQEARRRLAQNHLAVASIWVLGAIVLFCLLAPIFSPYSYESQDLDNASEGPSAEHWFGTDDLGRDQLTRLAVGGRVSMQGGLVATAVALVIGVTWGSVAAFSGGRLGASMMRIVDVIYAMPFTILVILLMTVFERSFNLLFIAIGCTEWLTMARIVHGQVNSLKRQDFIEAAVALGLSRRAILVRHLLPNILGIIAVYTTLTVPTVILLESFLSFLGLGVPPPVPSWGTIINNGADNMVNHPYLLVIPAFLFSLTLFCMNFIGDGLRDALDPKSSRD